MLWSEFQRYAVFPFFQLTVQLADSVEEFAVGLLGCLDRVQSFVDVALDDGEGDHESEEICSTFAVCEWNVAHVVGGVLARQFHIHVIVVLNWWPTRSQTDTTNVSMSNLVK